MTEATTWPQYLAAVSVCLGAWSTGTVLGWTANVTDDLKSGKLNGLKMANEELEWAGSCCTLGAMAACLPIGFLADALGRKPTCLATVAPFVLGWLLITYSMNHLMVYVGRVLTGAAGGAFVVIGPIYIAEIAQTHIRGRLATFVQVFIVVGVLYDEVLGWALPMFAYNVACLVVPIVFGVMFAFQPETPVYQLKKGPPEQAEKSLRHFRGKNYDFKEELALIEREIEEERKMGTFRQEMKTKANRKATCICIALMLYQQLTGVNGLSFYSKDILLQSGSIVPQHFAVIATGVVGLISTLLAATIIDRNGRRVLLQLSCALCALSTFLLSFYFTLTFRLFDAVKNVQYINVIPPTAFLLFCLGFNVGLGPIPWLAAAELVSPAVKQFIGSLACFTNWLTAFLVTRFCLTMAERIGSDYTFYIFTGITISCIFFVFFFVPETKNLRYDRIKEELEK
ncbi:unnamed protein product [Phyllotreta striolata]|uniref:Major facilitator superfamily (MFS) profile domain-containing protein n=1 Tax=Phyllotreta striolata TaxID=444603 RepID=A0A9N9XH61_PHYSR|nr:unnamed protein product [Phyllotreta striolata]